MMRRTAVGIAVATVLMTAATAPGNQAPALTVFAAADLIFAFREMVPRFERASRARVTLTIGSTGNFAHQIAAGAPADVFFSANEAYIDDLAASGHVIPDTRTLYAQGRLALATGRRAGPQLTDLRHLAEPRVRTIAIANPQHAPYGKAAEQALRAVGIWDRVKPKLVYGENIRHTLQFLQSGAADAGIVALSVANVPEIVSIPVDPALHRPLNQVAVVVRRSAVPELGVAFIQFVIGREGRPIMKRFGFLLPGEF
ncbi:MAG: molybdate ABC transporter substrate-binding protein [Candidatus Rokubacteria bacterium]|nr:molybdate ABC transporter substrate-binding protein [Candidatus Rokubacteria bacterium]